VSGAKDAVDHVEIATARERPARVQCLVEAAKLDGEPAPEDHVAAGADAARPARVEAITRKRAPVSHLPEAVAEAAVLLEEDLGRRGELVGQYRSGDRGDVGMLGEPPGIDRHVVVEVGDELGLRLPEGAVAGEVEALGARADVAGCGRTLRDLAGPLVRGRVVDDEELELRVGGGGGRRERLQRREAARQLLGAIVRADHRRQARRAARPEHGGLGRPPGGIGGPAEKSADVVRGEHRAARSPMQHEVDRPPLPADDDTHPVVLAPELDAWHLARDVQVDQEVGHLST
jgi:hypothetical protein